MHVLDNGRVYIRGNPNKFNEGKNLPLVLIDGIQMAWPNEMGFMLDSPLEMVSVYDIESIDIYKTPTAIFGPAGVYGVISIITKRGKNIKESDIIRLNVASYSPLGYQTPVEFYAPKYDTNELKYNSIPDYRTTIYWKPDIIFSDDGKASFDFYTSDFPTTCSIVIEGVSNDGKIIRQVKTIEVQ